MNRYFINVQIRGELIQDYEGNEFVTFDAVLKEAMTSAKQLVAYDLMQGLALSDALNGIIEIQDCDRNTLSIVSFNTAAEISIGSGQMKARY